MRAYHTTKAPEPTLDSVLWRYGARLLARRHSVERRPRGVRPRDSLGRGEGQVQVLVDDEEEAAVRGQRLDRGDDRVRRALHLLIRRADQRGALLRDAERREDGLSQDVAARAFRLNA